jgi:hypothetical protein
MFNLSRSDENWNTLELLLRERRFGVAIGLLRQEIDTFIRLVYLDTIDDPQAAKLINGWAQGKRWPVRDAVMVSVAEKSYFWVEIAYEFGCKLIHLSDFHDYQAIDPFGTMPIESKRTIIGFLRTHHGYTNPDIDLAEFVELMPPVMNKIRRKVIDYALRLDTR